MKQALADQGITGERRSMTERAIWGQKQKEALAEIMLEHNIEWEQKGEHWEHLSVLEYKREQRAELEQTIQRVQQQQVDIEAVEQIKAKPLPFSSKVSIERRGLRETLYSGRKVCGARKVERQAEKVAEGSQENHCRSKKHNYRSESTARSCQGGTQQI